MTLSLVTFILGKYGWQISHGIRNKNNIELSEGFASDFGMKSYPSIKIIKDLVLDLRELHP
jgi:hypothetical protein